MIMRSSLRSAAWAIMRCAVESTPAVALMTMAAVSTASSAGSDCPTNSSAPGVSRSWMRMPSCRQLTMAVLSECWTRFSSGSWSLTVEPRSTLPAALMAPARSSKASVRVVLPVAEAPTSATLRIAAISVDSKIVMARVSTGRDANRHRGDPNRGTAGLADLA